MSDRSPFDVAREAIRQSLAEEALDLAACEERASEPDISFESVVEQLKRRNKI